MLNARTTKLISALAIVPALAAAVFIPSEVQAAAGGIQNCTVGSTCTIGEFLFDDASAPIVGATCTITSSYPDHTSFLSSENLSGGGSDGWYYYEFTSPATTGIYSTQISCTVSGDTLSIDKSFEVVTAPATDPDAIASSVWASPDRSLTSFGSLVSDIWSYSGRTVTSFGTLIADIWANATRTLTGASLSSGSLATTSDTDALSTKIDNIETGTGSTTTNTTNVTNVTNTTNNEVVNTINDIKNLSQETRLLLEQVVNKPIIENVLEESVPDLGGKIQGTRASANQIYVNSQYLTSQSAALGASWNSKSGKDLLASVIELSSVLGEEGDSSSSDTVFGQANYIRDSWNWDEADSLYEQLVSARKITEELKSGLADYEKDPALYTQAKALVKSFLAIEKIVGTASDTSSKKTIFAKIKTTEALTLNLDEKGGEVDKVLGAFVRSKDATVASAKAFELKNQVIALNKVPGVVNALARINPNDATSIKNVLLGLKGIINSNKKLLALGAGKTLVNTWLEIGSIVFKTVATNPSKLISQDVNVKYYLPVEIGKEDIIKTDEGLSVEYDSEKNQLYVAGTFTLAAGQTRTFSVETKDIWEYSQSSLDSMRTQADELYKPLEKTAYFAQAVSLKSDIGANLDKMIEIQSQAVTPEDKIKAYRECKILKSSVDTKIAGMRDLVTQASAAGNLFGFVGGSQSIAVWGLILIIAVGFIFMTTYMRTIMNKAKVKVVHEEGVENKKLHNKLEVHSGIHPLKFVAIMIASSVISAASSGILVSKIVSRNYEQKLSVLGEKTEVSTQVETAPVINDASPVESDQESDLGVGGPYLVTVSETPTGFLRVRKTPGGVEIAKVNTGDKLPFLDENEEWYQVSLESGEVGWVSKEYSIKE